MRDYRELSANKDPLRRLRRLSILLWESRFALLTGTLAVTSAAGSIGAGPVVAAHTEAALGWAAAPLLDQPDPTATIVPDLPSLSAEPVAVAVALDAALNGGDLETVLGMFDDAAQVKIPPDMYVGSSQIRNWASYLVANHFSSEPGLRHLGRETITWPAEVRSDQLARFGLASLHGDATLTVRGGKIASYTFVLTRESASQLRAAQIAAVDVLQDPLVVGADFANVYGSDDVFRGIDGMLVSYRDLVGAEPGSGPYFDLGGQPVVLRTGL